MRIGINALFWTSDAMGGTQTYFLNLVKALLNVFPEDDFVVFVKASEAAKIGLASPRLRLVRCRIPVKLRSLGLIWEYSLLPFLCRKEGLDVLHSLGYLSPIVPNTASVVTVLDMIHYVFPSEIEVPKRLLWRVLFPLSLRTADCIVSISREVGREVSERFGWAASKVVPIHLGVDHKLFRPANSISGEGGPRFVLSVASISRHKNLERLIRAFAKARRKLPNTRLVLVGMRTPRHGGLSKLVERVGLNDVVEFTGRISDAALVKLYQTASALAFPSLYEGFGLPLLEAMACGCPVIASDLPTIRETAGDAALFVDAEDSDGWAAALNEVLGSGALRESLIERGLRHADAYTWEETARKTMMAYRGVARGAAR